MTYLHDSDLSNDNDLLKSDLDACRDELKRLRKLREAIQVADIDTPFHRVIGEVVEMHNRKQRDYGREGDPFANVRASEDYGVAPWIGALIRANDKNRRLQKAARGGKLANESVRDSLIDNIVYFIIATVLYDETIEQ